MDERTENDAILEAAAKLGDAEILELEWPAKGHTTILSMPEGRHLYSIKSFLDEYRDKPERRTGTAAIATLTSFIEHVNRHKDKDSAIFADVTDTEAKIVCVYDYNPMGPEGGARFGVHRAVFPCPYSDEWKAWTAKRGEMSQADFARFLEDRIMDVLEPAQAGEGIQAIADKLAIELATPQRLMDLSRGLTLNVGQRVTNAVNLSSGEAQVSFEEKHVGEGGGAVKVPGGLVIAIPVFRNSDVLDLMAVRLRYRHQQGAITWTIEPHRVDRVRDNAIKDAVDKIKTQTELPVFFGRPEV